MARHTHGSAAEASPRTDDDDHPGRVINDRYRLERPIGAGGMATIWEATHLALNRQVAVKLIELPGASPAQSRARFLREARVAAAVRHRNVVDILDFGTDESGRPFMVMERLVGQPLSERLGEGPMSVGEAIDIVERVLCGLAAVHDANIIHRDLKPENVFLVEDADGTFPKLLDFGVSRALDPTGDLRSVLPTVENAIIGTPQYMSPEQARGLSTVDHRSDLWSAGVMLFEMLTGTLPFDGEAAGDVILQIVTSEPPAPSALCPDLAGPIEQVVRKAMERDREDRFQSAREMRAALLDAATAMTRSPPGTVEARARVPAPAQLPTLDALATPASSSTSSWGAADIRSRHPTMRGWATPAQSTDATPAISASQRPRETGAMPPSWKLVAALVLSAAVLSAAALSAMVLAGTESQPARAAVYAHREARPAAPIDEARDNEGVPILARTVAADPGPPPSPASEPTEVRPSAPSPTETSSRAHRPIRDRQPARPLLARPARQDPAPLARDHRPRSARQLLRDPGF